MHNEFAVLDQRGFTLLEIIIALFIFTLVSVIMASGIHSVFNSQTAVEKKADQFSELQITLLLMSRDLEQTINRPIINAKSIAENAMIGTARSVTFTHTGFANPGGTLPRSTLQRTHYFIDKQTLIRETWQVLDQSTKSESAERTLLDSVENLRFEYLDNKGQFHQNWPPADNQQMALPYAIRVYFTLKNWGNISQLYLLAGTET